MYVVKNLFLLFCVFLEISCYDLHEFKKESDLFNSLNQILPNQGESDSKRVIHSNYSGFSRDYLMNMVTKGENQKYFSDLDLEEIQKRLIFEARDILFNGNRSLPSDYQRKLVKAIEPVERIFVEDLKEKEGEEFSKKLKKALKKLETVLEESEIVLNDQNKEERKRKEEILESHRSLWSKSLINIREFLDNRNKEERNPKGEILESHNPLIIISRRQKLFTIKGGKIKIPEPRVTSQTSEEFEKSLKLCPL